MSQIPILSGIYSDASADFRTSYPRNLIPVPKENGISKGYLRPCPGLRQFSGAGPGADRGGISWNGVIYRVMGSKLIRVAANGAQTILGDVGIGGQVTLDYSFDKLGIASAGTLYYWDGAALTSVTDPDIGYVVDAHWIAGYWMTTDGTNIIVTDLDDPYSVNPLKYGSSESDPDPVLSVDELRNEAYAFNRFTIEVFQNVAGDLFPFARIEGAQVPKGVIGTHAYCEFLNSYAFVGSGRNESPAVYLMVPGDTQKLSTREIDQILAEYTEAQLSTVVVESQVDKNHNLLLIHLPDRCIVYDAAASAAAKDDVWHVRTTSLVGLGTYRARNMVWCYDMWTFGDPVQNLLGSFVDDVSSHYGLVNGWDFGTLVAYGEGNDAIVHEIELVCLTGRVALGSDPVIWTQYSSDGMTWSQERPKKAGKIGDRNKRIAWRTLGTLRNWRIQRFRGTSDAHISVARLEVQFEVLRTRPGNG